MVHQPFSANRAQTFPRMAETASAKAFPPVGTAMLGGEHMIATAAPSGPAARPQRSARRSSIAPTLGTALLLGTSVVAGYHSADVAGTDETLVARATTISVEMFAALGNGQGAATERTPDPVAAKHMWSASFANGEAPRLARAPEPIVPEAMIADALTILGQGQAAPVRTARSGASPASRDPGPVGRRERPGAIDPIVTGSSARPATVTAEAVPGAPAAKRGRLRPAPKAAPVPTEERIERGGKRGRLVAKAEPGSTFALLAPPSAPRELTSLRLSGLPDEAASSVERAGEMVVARLVPPAPTFEELPATAPAPYMVARAGDGAALGSTLTAFAPVSKDFAARSRFDALLKREGTSSFVPPIGREDHGWARRPLNPVNLSKKQQHCLATGIYFEARGESKAGQAAVAQVILNRVRAPSFPNTVCGVVYQNRHWRNRCQFSFACDGIKDRVRSPKHWRIAKEIASAVSTGKVWFKDVGSSTHYHATYVNPRWNKKMKRVAKVGLHIFYRTRNGGWD